MTYPVSFLKLFLEPCDLNVLEHAVVVISIVLLRKLILALLLARVIRKCEFHFVRNMLLSPDHLALRSSEALLALRHDLLSDMRSLELGITPAHIVVLQKQIHIIIQILSEAFFVAIQILLRIRGDDVIFLEYF